MKHDDVQLIQSVLEGDDTAFSTLVRKYQRSVHALAWRRIGDFHIAEDITQETFLKAYQRLSTLKKPQRFASWLYVIAANQCKAWLRKKHLSDTAIGRHEAARSWKKRRIRDTSLKKTNEQRQNRSAKSSKSCLRNSKRANAPS